MIINSFTVDKLIVIYIIIYQVRKHFILYLLILLKVKFILCFNSLLISESKLLIY